MKLVMTLGIMLLTGGLLGAGTILLAGCSLHRPPSQAGSPANGTSSTAGDIEMAFEAQPAPASQHDRDVVRVAGDTKTTVEFVDGEYRCGECRITTPLPKGYPAPTAPGAIELKWYPLVRRAEIGGTITPDWGMNFAFFPLFNHIKRRKIAMTSPVEMNYEGLDADATKKPRSWTMSFVYRTPDLGPDGADAKDDRILVEDIPPMTVIAIGMRGPYKLNRVKQGVVDLRAWLSGQAEWEEAGDPRALYYNGPEMGSVDKWSEIQIPVRRR
ncbi:MAG: heme-binding protein [Phycisphaerae bacterium]|nr:heme-binding protein [Phycisphaerae bacterium]